MFLYYHLFVYFYKNAEDKGKFFSISKLQKKFRNRIYYTVYKKNIMDLDPTIYERDDPVWYRFLAHYASDLIYLLLYLYL